MSSTPVVNTKHTETVQCIKDSHDLIKEYESMTLLTREEVKRLIEETKVLSKMWFIRM